MLLSFFLFDRDSNELIFYHSHDGDLLLMEYTKLALVGLNDILLALQNDIVTSLSTQKYYPVPQDRFYGLLQSTESFHVYGYITHSMYKFIAITSSCLPPSALQQPPPPPTTSTITTNVSGPLTQSNLTGQVLLSPLTGPAVIKGQMENVQVEKIQSFFAQICSLITRVYCNPLSDLFFAGDINGGGQIPLFQPKLGDYGPIFGVENAPDDATRLNSSPNYAPHAKARMFPSNQPGSHIGLGGTGASSSFSQGLYDDRCLIQQNSPNLFTSSAKFQNAFLTLFNNIQV
jgi:hypothetical protein